MEDKTSEATMPKLLASILKAKGLTDEQLTCLVEAGVQNKSDLLMVGDAATLSEITGIDVTVAASVMEWATGAGASQAAPVSSNATSASGIVVESADVVRCTHCDARQPVDYQVGDLCVACGHQAEPVLSCHWCHHTGPGKFCRSCGSAFVPAADYEVALYLKREGESKSSIVSMVETMTPEEKANIWARIRRSR